jgi:signal transduction histidine kinase
MNETLRLARALLPTSGRRLAAEALARHLDAEFALFFVRDRDVDILTSALGFPQTLPGGSSWTEFFARCQDLGVHSGTIAFPDGTTLRPYRALVQMDGVLMLVGGEPIVDESVELATAFLLPMFRAEQFAAACSGRVQAAQEAARKAHGLAAALDSTRADLERALRAQSESVAALRASTEERERLLGIVGHDLRNPLSAIVMSTAMIARRGGLSDEQSSGLRRIQRTANRMGEMIRGLLDRERIRNGGGLSIEPRAVSVSELVAQVAEEARLAHPAVRFEVEIEVGPEQAHWDSTRVAQLLSNLLGNAAQHGAAGRPAHLRARSKQGSVELVVSNELLAPIADSDLKRMFDPFRRGESSSGLGLGLHIVRAIAEAHGGTADVESDGRTILFRVSLPLHAARGQTPTA